MEPVKFKKLEERVSRLLGVCETLKADHCDITEQLRLKEHEVKELKDRLSVFEREKGAVKEKVEGLITRLDGLIQNA